MTATSTPTPPAVDPLDAAMNAQPASAERTYFGEVVIVDAYFCKLVKGQGKVVFDPSVDSLDQRRVAIKLSVEVPRRDGTAYTIDQDTLDFEKEWTNFTLPSLRSLGLNLKNLKGRHVQVKRKPTGAQYTNKTGDLKDRTALVFVEVYPDAAACQRAADAFYSRFGSNDSAAPAAPTAQPATPAQPASNPPVNDAERQFAQNALQVLWNASGKVKPTFLSLIQSNPMVAKYFNEESPEVQHYLADGLPF